jgi:hypothetical protein
MVKDGYWWIEYSEYDGIADFSTTEILNCIVEKIVDKHNEAMKRIQDAKP